MIVTPSFLTEHAAWLTWKLEQNQKHPGGKPLKVPYYADGHRRSGTQGSPADVARLAQYKAVAFADMLGFAMLPQWGLIGLDFDNCFTDGVLDPEVERLVACTYAERSPSGNGVRAFMQGEMPDSKSPTKPGQFGFEVFHSKGFLTITGEVLDVCELLGNENTCAPLTDEVRALAAARKMLQNSGTSSQLPITRNKILQPGSDQSLEDLSYLADIQPIVGSVNSSNAATYLQHHDKDDRAEWLRVGAALHHQFDGDSEGLTIWDAWSAESPKYQGLDDLEKTWASFGRREGKQLTFRTILRDYIARAAQTKEAERRNTRDHARAEIETCEDSIALIDTITHGIGAWLGGTNDVGLTAEMLGLIRARFRQLTRSTLSLPDARRALAAGYKAAHPQADGPRRIGRYHCTEFGNSERMLDKYGQGLMFVADTSKWYTWSGLYWELATNTMLEHMAKETVKAIGNEMAAIENVEDRDALGVFCTTSERTAMVMSMITLSSSSPAVVVRADVLDCNKNLLGAGNGVVDLTTGELLKPDPEYRITLVTPTIYSRGARCPVFERTVSDVFFGDRDSVAFFQRLMGYALLGQPNEDLMVIPYGNGCNGKSTVLNAIRAAWGAHACTADSGTFLGAAGGKGGGAREDILRLQGRRLVVVTEPDEGSELREGLIKSMTGGEAMPARGLYATTTIEVQPTWTVVMPTNHKPVVKGDDHGIWRRLLPVPFVRNFDRDLTVEKDADRAEKLLEELPGILRWCVVGALEYKRIGLTPPQNIVAARDEYKGDMDLLAEWLDSCCMLDSESRETNGRLWDSWEMFSRGRGDLQYIRSSRALGRRLAQRFTSERWREDGGALVRGYVGLRVPDLRDYL